MRAFSDDGAQMQNLPLKYLVTIKQAHNCTRERAQSKWPLMQHHNATIASYRTES